MLLSALVGRRVQIRHVHTAICTLRSGRRQRAVRHRGLITLAIETSCDDTSVAILEKHENTSKGAAATLHFHDKVTADTNAYSGIHPLVALESHQTSLAPLVEKAINYLPNFSPLDGTPSLAQLLLGSHDGELRKKPNFISVTRGPGMRSNLSIGLDVAKGLAVAWRIPLLGVHHMQAHALTPRLVHALSSPQPSSGAQHAPSPAFPFLSLLVSGGHTMLISSTDLTTHSVLASTGDIALGDCLDKSARAILPASLHKTPYGRALETFAFPFGSESYDYTPPASREQELARRPSVYGWSFGPPLAESKGGRSSKRMTYSFSGLLTAVERSIKYSVDGVTNAPTKELRTTDSISMDERKAMAREVQRVAFEHLGSRVLLHLSSLPAEQREKVKTLVVSGGVAANGFLRHVLNSMLDVRGYGHVELVFPPVELCTDNAAMIAWAGMEMWEQGWRSDLGIRPIRKWSLDSDGNGKGEEAKGVLGVDGWVRRHAL